MTSILRRLAGLTIGVVAFVPMIANAAVINQHSFTWWDDPNQGVIVTPLGAANPTGNATQLLNLREWHVDQAQTQAWYGGGPNANLPANPFNAANRIGLTPGSVILPVAGAEAFIYEITNVGYGSGNTNVAGGPFTFTGLSGFPGQNGLSGINIIDDGGALQVSGLVPGSQFMFNTGILDLTPGSAGVPDDWDFNAFSGAGNFEWDIQPTVGNGLFPGQSAVFGFAMPGNWRDQVNNGWVHSWNAQVGQVNVTPPVPGFSGPRPLPEPSTLTILGLGLAGVCAAAVRRKRAA